MHDQRGSVCSSYSALRSQIMWFSVPSHPRHVWVAALPLHFIKRANVAGPCGQASWRRSSPVPAGTRLLASESRCSAANGRAGVQCHPGTVLQNGEQLHACELGLVVIVMISRTCRCTGCLKIRRWHGITCSHNSSYRIQTTSKTRDAPSLHPVMQYCIVGRSAVLACV